MSAYLAIDTVATSIAAVSISGVTVKDATGMLDAVEARECPILMPAPNYLSNIRVERESFGLATVAKKTIYYDLTYRLFYEAVGATRGLADIYNGLCTTLDATISAFVDDDALSGTIDIVPAGALAPGIVTDAAGGQFYGTDITLNVIVFVR